MSEVYRLLNKDEPVQAGDEVLPLGIHYRWTPVVNQADDVHIGGAVVRRPLKVPSFAELGAALPCNRKQGDYVCPHNENCTDCVYETTLKLMGVGS